MCSLLPNELELLFRRRDVIEAIRLESRPPERRTPNGTSDMSLLLTDSVTGSVLDSIDVALLDAAEVDDYGRTITANIYDSNVSLSSSQIDALINSNRLLLDITMNSFDNQNSAVRLYTDYQFNISLGAILELNIAE